MSLNLRSTAFVYTQLQDRESPVGILLVAACGSETNEATTHAANISRVDASVTTPMFHSIAFPDGPVTLGRNECKNSIWKPICNPTYNPK